MAIGPTLLLLLEEVAKGLKVLAGSPDEGGREDGDMAEAGAAVVESVAGGMEKAEASEEGEDEEYVA